MGKNEAWEVLGDRSRFSQAWEMWEVRVPCAGRAHGMYSTCEVVHRIPGSVSLRFDDGIMVVSAGYFADFNRKLRGVLTCGDNEVTTRERRRALYPVYCRLISVCYLGMLKGYHNDTQAFYLPVIISSSLILSNISVHKRYS